MNLLWSIQDIIKHFFQRRIRGFDDRDTWSMDQTFAKYLVPRLIRFKEINNGYPTDTEEEWDLILDKIIMTFKLIETNRDEMWSYDSPLYVTIKEGLDLFTKHYFNLWW